jgi:hypothetical protein
MNRKILIGYGALVFGLFGLAYIVMGLDCSLFLKKTLILLLCLGKTALFMVNVVKKEVDFYKSDIATSNDHYVLILAAVFLIISSYGLDYFLVYKLAPECFMPLLKGASGIKLLWNGFYYSSMIFFWMGIADINANCTTAQVITWAESMVTFFILSYGTFKFLKN